MKKENKNESTLAINEINNQINASLYEWSYVFNQADVDGWAHRLNFEDENLLDCLHIFTSVWSNNAIKRGVFDEKNVNEKVEKFRQVVKEVFDIDTVELTERVVNKYKKDEIKS